MKSAKNVRHAAENSFTSGLYCAESVLLALAEAQGIKSNLLPRIATGFCSGMARSSGTCGAVTGAIMGIGLALGRSRAEETVNRAYAATQRFIQQFETEFGARDCHQLLGCDLGTEEGQKTFRESGLRDRCTSFSGRAAELAQRIIEEARQ
jgi:C_GCAxxG_C_C family probable redox protein